MKYCPKCGSEVDDSNVYCPKCGTRIDGVVEEVVDPQPEYNETSRALRMVAFVFMIIGTISTGIFLLPLIWCIPMTVYYYHAYTENRHVGIAFKVCALLFVNLIAGILMLVDEAYQN